MSRRLSRRSFLAAGAGAALVAACGSDSKGSAISTASGSSAGPGGPTTATASGDLVLVTFSDPSALKLGQPQRLTFGFANAEGVVLDKAPAPTIDFNVVLDGQSVARSTVAGHSMGLPRPYFPLEFTPPTAGAYTVVATVNGHTFQTHVQFADTTTVVGPGQKMIPLDTPTESNQRGVQLLCTRDPACPLHDVTLREALAAGTPVAFLVATPKYCQTAICGPVLDVLLSQKDQFPQIKMLHAEVYPSDADAQPGSQKLTEAVTAYGLTFEPALYLAAPNGTIAKRLDTIFDGVELHDTLTKLLS